jgi:hypothetical protein
VLARHDAACASAVSGHKSGEIPVSANQPFLAHTEQWLFDRYCGFLRLSLKDWQGIQDRLMEEQLDLIKASPWAGVAPWGRAFSGLGEFRAAAPITEYSTYASRMESSRQIGRAHV